MPYRWQDTDAAPEQSGAVFARLLLWPHRSLPVRGFVWVIGLTAAGLAMPMLAMVGTPVLWGLLPFALLAVWGLWFALDRTYRSGTTTEVLTLTPTDLHLVHRDPGKADRSWHANPYWVRVTLRDGPVEDYLTLSAEGREVELGAFLSPEERRALHDEIRTCLARVREGGV